MIKNGILHRLDGSKEWLKDGYLHNDHGPAIEHDDGTNEWWINGKRHRDNGPAIWNPDGYKEWWREGKLHRDDGPAIERVDGTKEYWLDGNKWNEDACFKKLATEKDRKMEEIARTEQQARDDQAHQMAKATLKPAFKFKLKITP